MKTVALVLGAIMFAAFLWFAMICLIVFQNPEQTGRDLAPVAVAPEPPPVTIDPVEARKLRYAQARADLETSRAILSDYLKNTPNDLSRLKAENEKQRRAMCAAGDMPREYCDE